MNDTQPQTEPTATQPPIPPSAPAEPEKPVEAKPRGKVALPAINSAFTQLGFGVATYDAMVPPEHTLEDILQSTYWAHHAHKISIHAIIRAYHQGGKFDVDLRVVDCGTGFAKVRIRGGGAYSDAAAADALRPDIRALYKCRHIPGKRYVVQHAATGRIEVEGLPNMGEAEKWLDEHIDRLAKQR